MFFVDMLAVVLFWIVWHELTETIGEMDSKASIVKFYGNLFLMLIIWIGPVIHIIGTIEFLKPGTVIKRTVWGIDVNRFLVILLVVSIAVAFFLKHHIFNYIEKRGYVYCAEKSEWTTFSKEYVFVRIKAAPLQSEDLPHSPLNTNTP